MNTVPLLSNVHPIQVNPLVIVVELLILNTVYPDFISNTDDDINIYPNVPEIVINV